MQLILCWVGSIAFTLYFGVVMSKRTNRQRLELALERLKPEQWVRFEQFASQFLSLEFPNLRTVGSSGDRGRDAELFSPESEPTVLLQYSLESNWYSKIIETADTISVEHCDAQILIYSTNQDIRAKADPLKKTLRLKHRLFLDIRDRNYFLDHFCSTDARENVSEQLAEDIADPYLASREIIEAKAQPLTNQEARAALVYLGIQWEDDTRDKGLTKLCFDALVRSALRGTDSKNKKTKSEVRNIIRAVLPTHEAKHIDQLTDSALDRLRGKVIRYSGKDDAYYLDHNEISIMNEKLAVLEVEEQNVMKEIRKILKSRLDGYPKLTEDIVDSLASQCKRVIGSFFLAKGEEFVHALESGRFESIGFESLKSHVIRDQGNHPAPRILGGFATQVVIETVTELAAKPGSSTQIYLRKLADSYTLMAFLRETPDVQSATSKMFSYGEIWLDTSILLAGVT